MHWWQSKKIMLENSYNICLFISIYYFCCFLCSIFCLLAWFCKHLFMDLIHLFTSILLKQIVYMQKKINMLSPALCCKTFPFYIWRSLVQNWDLRDDSYLKVCEYWMLLVYVHFFFAFEVFKCWKAVLF